MPTAITNITKEFTYPVADELYSASGAANRTASASYTGPDRVWVFVDETTGNHSKVSPALTTMDDGGDVPVPVGHVRVEVVAEDDTLAIAMLKEDCVTYADTSQTSLTLPGDYGTFSWDNYPDLSETYDLNTMSYDIANSAWRTMDFLGVPLEWSNIISIRNNQLAASDGKISTDMPDAVKAPFVAYRTLLRNMPADYGYGTSDEIEAWKVKFPELPED